MYVGQYVIENASPNLGEGGRRVGEGYSKAFITFLK